MTGSVGQRASTGIHTTDFREILGFTSDKAEGMAGWSGARVLAILDEASGIKDEIHVAIRGNLAASGSREVLISNPTRAQGFFFDSHHTKKEFYKTIQVSSESTPNFVEGRDVFPGLASREWAAEWAAEHGADSPSYMVHVKGEFVLNEKGAIFSVHALSEATARWDDTEATGPLCIGIDPAGESGGGDESALAARRGKKLISITTRRGMSPEAHLVEALGLIATLHPKASKIPARIVIDRDGEVGAKVWAVFVAYLNQNEGAFTLVGVRGSERAIRKPDTYDRWRDELFAVLADWLRDGGAIVEDLKLNAELGAFRWIEHISGRTKAIGKDELRKSLQRSPDRADALALSCWAPSAFDVIASPVKAKQFSAEPDHDAPVALDPYAALDAWGSK